jgi:hypothetical protein
VSDSLEDYSFQNFIRHLKNGEIPNCHHMFTYHDFVSPSLPWKKIEQKLMGLDIKDEVKDLLIFILKPYPLEEEFRGFPKLKELEERVCGESNRKIKKLSPLLKQLENLQNCQSFNDFIPLSETVKKLKEEIAYHREIVKFGKGIYKKFYTMQGLDKDLLKSAQRHRFWNLAVSGALTILNQFYHTWGCGENCKKTHEETIRKVAELLKIIYPKIWKENIPTIMNRIKAKNYRQI